MKFKFAQKYLSIVFLLASLMGSMHHHNDLQEHNDCQICTISSSIADADTPVDVKYLTLLCLQSEVTLSQLPEFFKQHIPSQFHSRAPPKIIL